MDERHGREDNDSKEKEKETRIRKVVSRRRETFRWKGRWGFLQDGQC